MSHNAVVTKYITMLLADEWTILEIGELLRKTIPMELKRDCPDITTLDILRIYDTILIDMTVEDYLTKRDTLSIPDQK